MSHTHQFLISLLSLTIMGAGWYYLFYSRAAHHLNGIEAEPPNLQRIRMRRIGGLVMILLGICFYVGFLGVSWDPPSRAFFTIWLLVFFFLALIVFLALTDLRLTLKLHRQRQNKDRP